MKTATTYLLCSSRKLKADVHSRRTGSNHYNCSTLEGFRRSIVVAVNVGLPQILSKWRHAWRVVMARAYE